LILPLLNTVISLLIGILLSSFTSFSFWFAGSNTLFAASGQCGYGNHDQQNLAYYFHRGSLEDGLNISGLAEFKQGGQKSLSGF